MLGRAAEPPGRFADSADIGVSLTAALLTALGYYAGAQLGFALTLAPVPVSPLWPPNAILLAGLALRPPRTWPLILAAVFGAHLAVQFQSGVPAGMVLCWYVSNSAEALIGAGLLYRLGGSASRLETLRGVALFLGAVGLAAPFLSSFLDAAFVSLNGWGDASYWTNWTTRFFGNVLANITLVPVILLTVQGIEHVRELPRRPLVQVAGCLLLLAAICCEVFVLERPGPATSPALLYAPLPLLVAAAVLFGPWGAAAAMLTCAMVAIFGATQGGGPFVTSSAIENARSIQLFLVITWIPVMTLAAVIRERAVANAQVLWSEEQLAMAIDAARLGRWEWDVARRELTWSETTRAMYEVPKDGPVDPAMFHALVHPEDRVLMARTIADAATGKGVVDVEFRVRFSDGRIKWIHSRGRTILGPDGRPERMVGVKVDITARKTAELERHERQRRLAQHARTSVAGELSTALAHEVNQPLAAILMNATVARRVLQQDPPNLQELGKIVDAIADDNRQAAAAIRRCGSMLRTDEPTWVALNVNQLVGSFLDVARLDLLSRDVSVTRQLAEGLPAVVGDPVQLQQVLMNLVINACEAMESLAPADRRLYIITAAEGGGRVRLSVQDTGPGVTADSREQIFEPFVTTKGRRPGLGLAICRSIVSAHAGSLEVESLDGGGASFSVLLPAAP
jgi:two-component system, LuxR family, sensor kinase FixL